MTPSPTLHRHPLLAVEWLQLRNGLRRSGVIVGGAAATIVTGTVLLRYAVQLDLAPVAAHWPIVTALATLGAMSHVARRSRRLAADGARSWLAAAPIADGERRIALSIRVLAPLFVLTSLACVALLSVARSDVAFGAARELCGALWAGLGVGAALGGLAARRRERVRFEASRYTPGIAPASTLAPSDQALSRWPIAQAFAWGRPENLRALVIVSLLFGVQAGASALHGLLILAAWLLAGYLGSLLASVPATARTAADWLRSTPVEPVRFGWIVARRALVHHAIGMIVAALALSALGSPLRMTLTLGVLWASAITLVYGLGLWRSQR